MQQGSCPLCHATRLELVFRYTERPAAETDFGIPPEDYGREFWRCENCGHMIAAIDLPTKGLYEGVYMDATYSGKGMIETFDRIMSLPSEESDNAQRVHRIQEHFGGTPAEPTVLDVGSGLGVFPARMKEEGWRCTALDPDARAAEHLREIGVEAVQADFMEADDLGDFTLVALNKVLEHVDDPVAMLARCERFLAPGGVVYVEVPDGELAARDPAGPDREEFYIEHLWAFSLTSLSLLADRAGFDSLRVERVREPSDKYTLFAFLRSTDRGPG